MSDYEFLLKYQFSKESQEYVRSKNFNYDDISLEVLKKIEELFTKLFDSKNLLNFFKLDEMKIQDKKLSLDEELLIFPISKLILSTLDNVPLFQAFSNYYQKHFIYFINRDYQTKNYFSIEKIIKDLSPTLSQNEKGFYIPLVSFLEFDLGEEYKLQYTNLYEGNIYFPNKDSLVEFLSVVLKKRILRVVEVDKKQLPNSLLEFSKNLKEKFISLQKTKEEYNYLKPKSEKFPPCFKKLYTELLSGERLSHIANYHLAVFLFNVGFSYEEVLDLYRNLPNFDEKIAGYQIKNIFEKKYAVANCETLRTNGLCVAECKIRHPLQLLKKEEK